MALASKSFAEVVTFTRASPASYFGSDGLLKTAASGVPRTGAYADYNPATLAIRGFRVEEQRINYLLRSNDWSAIWSLGNTTQTPAQAIGIDGALSMTKLAATTSAATVCYQTFIAPSTTLVYSIYVKQGSGALDANQFAFHNNTTATTLVSLILNYTTGAITQSLGTGATAENIGGGIWRLSIPVSAGVTVGNSVQFYACFTGSPETAGEFAYVSRAQVEQGLFATSPIDTTTLQVTRAVDAPVISTLALWYNFSASTVFIEAQSMWTSGTTGNDRSMWSVSGGSNVLLGVVRGSGGAIQFHDETTYRVLPNGTYADGSIRKVAVAVDDPAVLGNAAINGVGATFTTDGTTLDARITAFNLGMGSGTGTNWCGWIRRFTVYPRQFSLAECVALTA